MRVLIIGFGSIGKKHFEILKELKQITSIDIVSKYKNELKNVNFYTNIEDVNLDLYKYIVIASPTFRHLDDLMFIENNCKDKIVLVEKPLFMDKQNLEIKRNKVYVAYNLRFTKIIDKIKKLIKNESIISANIYVGSYLPFWREGIDYSKRYSAKKELGGGVLLDLSHEIDYARYLLGEFENINAISKKVSSLKIDCDDICDIICTSSRCKSLNIHLDYLSFIPKRDIIIHTNEFTLKANLVKGKMKVVYFDKKMERFSFSDDIKNSYKRMHISLIKNKMKKITIFEDGLKSLKTIQRIRNAS